MVHFPKKKGEESFFITSKVRNAQMFYMIGIQIIGIFFIQNQVLFQLKKMAYGVGLIVKVNK